MKSWSYTPAKKALEFCLENGDFAPSNEYPKGYPFTPAVGYPKVSTWDLWFNELNNRRNEFDFTGTFAIYYNIEAVLLLIEDFGVNPSKIALVSDNPNKSEMALAWGCKVVTEEELNQMKFTHVLKNPPWDGGIYAKFWAKSHEILEEDGYQLDILPTNWLSLKDYLMERKYLLENFQILSLRIYDNRKKQVFDIFNPAVLVMVSKKCSNPDNSKVEYTFMDQPTFTVDLNSYDVWPFYFSSLAVSILDKVMKAKTSDLETGHQDPKKDIHMPTPYYVTGEVMAHKLFETSVDGWRLNDVKATISDPFYLHYPTDVSAQLHYEWYQSDSFNYVLSMLKSQPKNQPYLPAMTGLHSFTNNNFDQYFGFTQEQLEEIARWKSSK